MAGYKWKRLEPAVAMPPSEAVIATWMQVRGVDHEEARRLIEEEAATVQLWRNDLYQVQVREIQQMIGDQVVPWCHLNIRRIDGYVGRDWRHFQQIKNELVGPECEAVELYPAESRLIDTSNKYHLWACRTPGYRFPLGFSNRDVAFGTNSKDPGLRQSPAMQFAGASQQESTDANA